MSESIPSSEQPETAPESGARKRTGLVRLVPRSRGARWAAVGAAAVIVGGGVAVAAVAEHHHGPRERGIRAAVPGPGHKGDGNFERKLERKFEDGPGRGPVGQGERHEARKGGPKAAGPGAAARKAPAPLPSLAIGQAADKAAAAVPGGKVEGLRAVAQEGGGSAWLAVVLGSDGVRHAVTVSGTDGTITANVTLDRR
ncbi:hypothetical protein OOK31_02675 [Streptomyces sp. NBC_00249]|uniref:hypothetical protein n=1 Tax=Streptomyces sp. NBC_00249 TaxID=2975690 RepID=UPI0022554C3C|nr:hypothetical protein [Streptomyces sp. NBC_00249]MCX5192806.1 hypothetical protein [Streptomyces sp. NBC_00249]